LTDSLHLEWPIPKNVKELQSFLELANYYRRFIPSFVSIAHPLHCLLKKNSKFNWSTEIQNAFENRTNCFSVKSINMSKIFTKEIF